MFVASGAVCRALMSGAGTKTTVMRIYRFIFALLVTGLLFSDLAWSLDACGLPPETPAPQMIGDGAPSEPAGFGKCSGYCVGWAQLLFVSYRPAPVFLARPRFAAPRLPSFYHSLDSAPPTEPPRV